jgi:hypothetical protein
VLLTVGQAALFPRLSLAHLARFAAAILRRADADIVRLPEFAIGMTFCRPLTLAQRALWAAAILARPLADIFRRGLIPLLPRYTPAKASSAAFSPDNCKCSRSRSLVN